MSQNYKKDLTGEQLFDYYTGIDGEYKSVLFQAHVEIGDALFPMLEQAEKEGKKIVITEDMPEAYDSPTTISIE
jgi:hypothetical protein